MGRQFNSRKRGSITIVAILVAAGGLIIVQIFLLESEFLLTFFTVIALCGVLGWISIIREIGPNMIVQRAVCAKLWVSPE
jgi:hypothetical protein